MISKNSITPFLLIGLLMGASSSCRKDNNRVAMETPTLEAMHVKDAPNTVMSPYWKTAHYLKVATSDVSSWQMPSDGSRNMSGTLNGRTSFNNGVDPNLTLRAAYDDEKIYILAEWVDSRVDLSAGSWIYNGPLDPLMLNDSTPGWSSQRSSDKLAYAFEIESTSSSAGAFSDVGCQAACHNDGLHNVMVPEVGKTDIWKWDLALTAPLGYAADMNTGTAEGFIGDFGDKMYHRNIFNEYNARSGPAYEWDGSAQSVTQGNGQTALLDPAFYLFNKEPNVGNYVSGHNYFVSKCAGCHGVNGEGKRECSVNTLTFSKKTRAALTATLDELKPMESVWKTIADSNKTNAISYMRALAGIPGYYLSYPSRSAADLVAVSNVTPIDVSNAMFPSTNGKHKKYQVLIIRKLRTGHTDDVVFDPANKTYKFGVALMDNDSKNHIGSLVETLTFQE